MDPLTASLAFATIVQLLCNYRQEKGAREEADLNEFLTWLTHHRFEKLKDQIQNSSDLQIEIQNLLQEEVGEISDTLNLINNSIVSLASKIDGLSGIARAMHIDQEMISDDAIGILKGFEASGDIKIGLFRSYNPPQCVLLPSGRRITGIEGRFLADDLSSLEDFNFIKCVDYNNSGDPLYALTRLGAKFAKSAT